MDYGRISYEKLGELSRRIDALESAVFSNEVMELSFAFSSYYTAATYLAECEFVATKNGNVSVSVELVSSESVVGQAQIYIGEVNSAIQPISGTSASFISEIGVKKGLVKLKLTTLTDVATCITSAKIKIFGSIAKPPYSCRMETVDGANYTHILSCGGKKAIIQVYSAESNGRIILLNVAAKSAAMAKIGDNLLLCYVDLERKLCFKRLELPLLQQSYATSFGGGFSSLAASVEGQNVVVYAIKNARLKKYVYTPDNTISEIEISLGTAFYADASYRAENALVLTGLNQNARLIVFNSGGEVAKYKLPRAENYRLYTENSKLTVRYYLKGMLYRRTLDENGLSAQTAELPVEEKFTLVNGKILIRNNEEIKIIEDN